MYIAAVNLYPLGDSALVVQFDDAVEVGEKTQQTITAFGRYLDGHPFHGFIEYVPAFTTVSIIYDPLVISYMELRARVLEMVSVLEDEPSEEVRVVKIPVCYGGECGPDLAYVADYHALTMDDVIQIHIQPLYVVRMLGFAPGFPYLSGMPERIATPRLDTPRLRIPPGSVGIAGLQTGVYTIETPGGWQLIGRTPLSLFTPELDQPCLLNAGDRVQFVPISQAEYNAILGAKVGYEST